jgi:acrosin
VTSDLGVTVQFTSPTAGTINPSLPLGFVSIETVTGGLGDDVFDLGAGTALAGPLDGGGGNDTILGDNSPRTFSVTGSNSGTVTGLVPSGYSNVENLVGGSAADMFQFSVGGTLSGSITGGGGTDTLVGDNTGRTFTITGANAGTLGTPLSAAFSAIENLTGGSSVDVFRFANGGSLSGLVDGGGGSNKVIGDNSGRTFTFSGARSGTITGLFGTGFANMDTAMGGTGADSFVLNPAWAGRIDGGAGSDVLLGDNTARTYTVSQVNGGTVDGAFAFANIENLTAGSASDTLVVVGAGKLAGTFDGQAGTDLIDLSAMTAGVSLRLSSLDANGFNALGGSTALGGLKGFDKIDASTSNKSDSLIGLEADSTWQVKAGVGQSIYHPLSSGTVLVFSNFDSLGGGGKVDSFDIDFSAGPPVLTSGLTVNGGSGSDTLTLHGTTGADTFTLQTNFISVNGRLIRFAALEQLDAFGDAGSDSFRALAGTYALGLNQVHFYGEGGNDTAIVAPTTTTHLTFDGGAGLGEKDVLRINIGKLKYVGAIPKKSVLTGQYLISKNYLAIDFTDVEVRNIGVTQPA